MKLKLPLTLVSTLLVAFTTTSIYSADVALTQTNADAHKVYSRDIHESYNFTIGESITFTGYSITDLITTIKTDAWGKRHAYDEQGNIFRFGGFENYPINTFKGDALRSYSVFFSNNTVEFLSRPAPLPADVEDRRMFQAKGSAGEFINTTFSDLAVLSFSNNKLVSNLKGLVGPNSGGWDGVAEGGALYSDGALHFRNIDSLLFESNIVAGNDYARGGAMFIEFDGYRGDPNNCPRISNINFVSFDNNKALATASNTEGLSAGALYAVSHIIFEDIGELSFTRNMVGYDSNTAMQGGSPLWGSMGAHGGAISGSQMKVDRVRKFIMKDNAIDLRNDNINGIKSVAGGGAIDCITFILHNIRDINAGTEENSIIFEGNRVLVDYDPVEDMQKVTGGAIYTYYLNINNSGNVLFKNNYTTGFGGAVAFRYSTFQKGEVVKNELFAKYGDITFVGNTHRLASSNERNSGIANSIYFINFFLTSGETVINPAVCFAADSGRSIFFYDAIDSNEVNSSSLKLSFGAEGYAGSVVFSGEKVTETLAGSEASLDYAERVEASKQSAINAEMLLVNGSLILREGVTLGKLASAGETGSTFSHTGRGTIDISNSTLAAESFDARYKKDASNSIVGGGTQAIWKIGSGAKLMTNTIDFSDGVGIDLSYYMTPTEFQNHEGMYVTSTSMKLGGNLMIADHADYYTDNKWSQKYSFTLMDVTDAHVEGDFTKIISRLTGSNIVNDPYQYKGEWSFTWEGNKLIATWDMLGAITDVRPELEGNIISNSMWSSASNVKSLSNTALANANILRMESSLSSNFWVKGIGDFAYDDSSAELDGYSYQGGGYAAGADFKVGAKSIVGVAFGQLTGDNKSELYTAKIKQESMMGSIYAAHLQTLNKRNSLLWTLAGTYGRTDNSMNTHYSDGQNSAGSWNNNAYFVEAKMEWRISPEAKSWTYKPFIGLEYTDVSLDSFTETGDKARSFGDGKYKNLALPIGMGVEHLSHMGKKTWLNSLSLAYVPDVYREAPSTQATRLSNGFSWKDQGSKPSIHTLRASINSTLQLNAAWTAYAGYIFEAREGASYHNVNTGVSYSF